MTYCTCLVVPSHVSSAATVDRARIHKAAHHWYFVLVRQLHRSNMISTRTQKEKKKTAIVGDQGGTVQLRYHGTIPDTPRPRRTQGWGMAFLFLFFLLLLVCRLARQKRACVFGSVSSWPRADLKIRGGRGLCAAFGSWILTSISQPTCQTKMTLLYSITAIQRSTPGFPCPLFLVQHSVSCKMRSVILRQVRQEHSEAASHHEREKGVGHHHASHSTVQNTTAREKSSPVERRLLPVTS